MRCIQSCLLAILVGIFVNREAFSQQTNSKANEALQKRLTFLKSQGAQVIMPEGKDQKLPQDRNESREHIPPYTPPQDYSTSKYAEVAVTAETLWGDFSGNVVAAEKKYSGKTVAVKGQVAAIRGDNSKATIYLTGREALIGAGVIACVLKPSEIDKAAALSNGEQVEIAGICGNKGYQGWIEGVEFSDCVFTTPVKNTLAKTTSDSIGEPVPIEEVIKEHRDNEIAARRKYDGKTFSFTGKVLKVDRTFTGESYVFMGGLEQMCDVYCYLDSKTEDELSTVRSDQHIVLRGVCHSASGALFDALKFSDCVMSR